MTSIKKNLIAQFISLFILISFSNYSKAQTINVGENSSFFICNNGDIMCSGKNMHGQLGIGSTSNQFAPVNIATLSQIMAASNGEEFTLFLKNDSTVWSTGYNNYGQLGDTTTSPRISPVQVIGLDHVKAISAGQYHSLFLKTGGSVWGCGGSQAYQLGVPSGTDPNDSAFQLSNLSDIVAVSAGYHHSLFLRDDGIVFGCGVSGNGELGLSGSLTSITSINGISNVKAIATGYTHSLFLKDDSTVWACGFNFQGQLGDGTNITRYSPVQVQNLSGVVAIAAGENHSLFLKNDGTVWACGWNLDGQLGDNTDTNRFVPVQVFGLSDVVEIDGGVGVSLFLKNDGTVWGCGGAGWGALGIAGTSGDQKIAIQVPGLCSVLLPSININSSQITQSENFRISFKNILSSFDVLSGTIETIKNEKLTIKILDLQGKTIYEKNIYAIQGFNYFECDSNLFANGLYFLIIRSGKNQLQKKFAVAN